MLTCEICGEEILLEEDMKTHLLLSHLENRMHCLLCSLSGVSYDELCFHISSAHPEKQHRTQELTHFTSSSSCSAATNAGVIESENHQTSQACLAGDSCTTTAVATTSSAPGFNKDSVAPKENSTHERECSTPGEATRSLKTRQESVRHRNDDSDRIQSEHDKAKHKRMSSPRKGDSNFQTLFQNFKSALT